MEYSFEQLISIIHQKIRFGDAETIRHVLYENPDILRPTRRINNEPPPAPSLMREAIASENAEIVSLLLDFGADANTSVPVTPFENEHICITPLQFISIVTTDESWEHSKTIARVLLERGADVNRVDGPNECRTPLRVAVQTGNVKYARFLLQNKAKIHISPEFTTSHWIRHIQVAPKEKQNLILQLLIQHGLDINDRDGILGQDFLQELIGNLALHPSKNINTNGIDIIGMARTLLDHGVSVSNYDSCGTTTLILAVIFGDVDLISLLIDRGAEVNQKSALPEPLSAVGAAVMEATLLQGFFPLLVAVESKKRDCVDLLLAKGADINLRFPSDGRTALHEACYQRDRDMIELLIRRGADITVENYYGRTALLLLDTEDNNESSVSCAKQIIQVIAKRIYFGDSRVSETDTDIIMFHPVLSVLFTDCWDEIGRMKRNKFYGFHTYYRVFSKTLSKIKLSKLTRCAEFVKNFESGLQKFENYSTDLQIIFEEATKLRDESLMVESRLDSTFGNLFPKTVVRKLASMLSVEDLPL